MPYREQLANSIDKTFLKRAGVQRVKHGEGDAYAVGDDVFAFLTEDGLVLKLGDDERAALLHSPNARPYDENEPGRHDELVELVMHSFADVMTGMEWLRRAYSEAATRAAKTKKHHRGLFSR
jgi:hypothetical protein